jgi:hypothetical protein
LQGFGAIKHCGQQKHQSCNLLAEQVSAWKESQITDDFARLRIYEAFIEEKLVDVPKHLGRIVHANYFDPQYPEFARRTKFSLQNAFTSAFKALDPIPTRRNSGHLIASFRSSTAPTPPGPPRTTQNAAFYLPFGLATARTHSVVPSHHLSSDTFSLLSGS